MSKNYILFDGECPFCSDYVRFASLRKSVGPVELINARDETEEAKAAREADYVLDEGMLLSLEGKLYYGADCLNMIAMLSTKSGVLNKMNHALFNSPRVARIAYPVLKFGRNATLRILGISRLGY